MRKKCTATKSASRGGCIISGDEKHLGKFIFCKQFKELEPRERLSVIKSWEDAGDVLWVTCRMMSPKACSSAVMEIAPQQAPQTITSFSAQGVIQR